MPTRLMRIPPGLKVCVFHKMPLALALSSLDAMKDILNN